MHRVIWFCLAPFRLFELAYTRSLLEMLQREMGAPGFAIKAIVNMHATFVCDFIVVLHASAEHVCVCVFQMT